MCPEKDGGKNFDGIVNTGISGFLTFIIPLDILYVWARFITIIIPTLPLYRVLIESVVDILLVHQCRVIKTLSKRLLRFKIHEKAFTD